MMRPGTLLATIVCVAACHKAPPAAPPAPAAAPDTVAAVDSARPAPIQEWTAGNLAIGNGVFVVRGRPGGRVYIGAGNDKQTITLLVDADAVTDFVAELNGRLPPHKAKANAPPVVLEEPVSGRTMSFGRHVANGASRYRFFFSDEREGSFSLPATLTETKAILGALTRGVQLARQAPPPDPPHTAP